LSEYVRAFQDNEWTFSILILSILPVLIVAFGETILAQINYKKDGEIRAEYDDKRGLEDTFSIFGFGRFCQCF